MSKKFLLELIYKDDDELNSYLEDIELSEFRETIRLGLLEQGRDTRHSCAEECLTVNSKQYIIRKIFHDTVMNCNKGIDDVKYK